MHIEPDGAIEATPLLEEIPEDEAGLKKLRATVLENPGVIYGQLVSHDHRAALINAGFITRSLDNSAAYTELFNYLQNLKAEEEADGTAEIYISGAPMATGFVVSQAGEMIGFLLLTIVSLFFLLLAYFRRLHGVAIPMVAGLATAIWGMGFCAWMGIKLDPLVMVIPMLITARSISHTIQMAERFFEDYEMECLGRERRLGRSITPEEADEAKVETATTAMAKLMLPGMLGHPGRRRGPRGLLPDHDPDHARPVDLRLVLGRRDHLQRDPAPPDHDRVPAAAARLQALHAGAACGASSPTRGPVTTGPVSKYVLAGGASLGLALATYYVLFNTTIGESRPGVPVFWPDHPFNVATGKIGEKFGGVDQLTVFVDGDGKSASSDGLVLQRMEAMQRYMRKYVDPGATSSLVDIIKSYWLVNHYNDPKWGFVPDAAQSIGGIVFQLQRSNIPGLPAPVPHRRRGRREHHLRLP